MGMQHNVIYWSLGRSELRSLLEDTGLAAYLTSKTSYALAARRIELICASVKYFFIEVSCASQDRKTYFLSCYKKQRATITCLLGTVCLPAQVIQGLSALVFIKYTEEHPQAFLPARRVLTRALVISFPYEA